MAQCNSHHKICIGKSFINFDTVSWTQCQEVSTLNWTELPPTQKYVLCCITWMFKLHCAECETRGLFWTIFASYYSKQSIYYLKQRGDLQTINYKICTWCLFRCLPADSVSRQWWSVQRCSVFSAGVGLLWPLLRQTEQCTQT